MNNIKGVILACLIALITPYSVHADELPVSLKGAPEGYITASLCIQMASIYYHKDQGIELMKAVGRASYDCKDKIDDYLSLLLKTPSISAARQQSGMTEDDALNFLQSTQIFQMKIEALHAITESTR